MPEAQGHGSTHHDQLMRVYCVILNQVRTLLPGDTKYGEGGRKDLLLRVKPSRRHIPYALMPTSPAVGNDCMHEMKTEPLAQFHRHSPGVPIDTVEQVHLRLGG